MMDYWKCQKCHGTGRVFEPWYAKTSERCFKCDGTGNALVDGAEARQRRKIMDENDSDLSARFRGAR